MNRALSVLLVSILGLVACGGGGEKSERPPRPADGSPVVVEFVSLVGQGKRRAARVKIHNYTNKDVTSIRLDLRYLDATGKVLKTFPWGMSAHPVVASKKSVTTTMGAFLPAETARVDARVLRVEMEGDVWEPKKAPPQGAP